MTGGHGFIDMPQKPEEIGEFGGQTLSSTLKTLSLFKNHNHRHIDQIDGNDF